MLIDLMALEGLTDDQVDEAARVILTERDRRYVLAQTRASVEALTARYADAVADQPARDYSPGAWAAGQDVTRGDLRTYGGVVYLAVQAHRTQADWAPDVTPALWTRVADLPGDDDGEPDEDDEPEPEPDPPEPEPDESSDRPEGYVGPWDAGADYLVGDVVDSGGRYYECLIAHGAERQGTWPPGAAHTVWTDVGPAEDG